MTRQSLSSFRTSLLFALGASCCAGLGTGCTDHRSEQASTAQSSTFRQPPPKDSTRKVDSTAASADMPLTLPVLDALFYEEGFEGEVKSKLSLTAEQMEKLKTVSHESVADLSEEGDYTGSARGMVKQTEEQFRNILGEEKAAQLSQLVNQRYTGGDVQGLMPTTPNAVPADTRIVVNAPAYRMDVFQDGKLTKTYRIGIGYPEFPLPTGMRRAESIIFNPAWTPPDEAWVKGKFKVGKKVEAGSRLNPLGPIKIPIGLPSLIHGGKSAAKLGYFASHGCVGMTNEQVQEFATMLAALSGSSLTLDSVQGYSKKKDETKQVKLGKAIPVELRYETIVAENGTLRIYRDVYERGTNTEEDARRLLDAYGISYESLSATERAALRQALTEMNRDPQGKPIIENPSDTAAGSKREAAVDSGRRDGVAASKLAGAKKGKVTSTIVGRKEIAVPIAALQGKGYPAPVNLNAGGKVAGTVSRK